MTFTDPPAAPSPTGLVAAFGVLVLLAGLALVAAWCQGCSDPPAKHPAYCTDEIAFTARLLACVEQSPTRELSRACRKAVHERCGIVETVSWRSEAP